MIISESDLVVYMQRPLTTGESTAASAVIEMVQAELEHSVLQRSLVVAEHTETLYGTPDREGVLTLHPTHTPLLSVSAVTVEGAAVASGSWSLERSRVLVYGVVLPLTGQAAAEVTYTAGLGEPALTACRRVLLGCVARVLEKGSSDELGLDSVSVEGYSAVWMSEGFTDEEIRRVSRWRRRVTS